MEERPGRSGGRPRCSYGCQPLFEPLLRPLPLGQLRLLSADLLAVATMPAWLAILLALLLIYFTLNPSHEGYAWYLRLRRPPWFDFEAHIPLIWLGLYVCFFSSARLVLEPEWQWSYAISFLLLVAMAQGTSWLVCTSRSLAAGVVLGILAWLWNLGMILALLKVNAMATAFLVPYLLWGPVAIVGRQQMRGLNTGGRSSVNHNAETRQPPGRRLR